MDDVDKLIEMILSDNKISGSTRNFKEYKDEPILFTASQMKSYTPPKYIEMKKLANSYGSYYKSETEIFYNQAKFMENFEDDFDYHGEFIRYFPTYQAMNNLQLRGYFSWRTKVRHGIIEKTSLSFAYVYIYELINQIGVDSAEDGYYKIKSFTENYSRFDSKINYFAKLWLKDYVVYYGLDKSLLSTESEHDTEVLILLNYKAYTADRVFDALCTLSSYNMKNSKFYKAFPGDVAKVSYEVYCRLSEYYEQSRKHTLCEKFFGTTQSGLYGMFASSVFFEPKRHPDCVYEISDIYKYKCVKGYWTCERFFCFGNKSSELGTLLKQIDCCMRMKYDFKFKLKPVKTTKLFYNITESEIDRFTDEKRKSELPKIEIDVSKLQSIRDTSLITQSKLIIDEEYDTDEETTAVVSQNDDCPLSKTEADFVRCLILCKPYAELLKSNGLMLSVLIDAINDKLFDIFEDTVIIFDGDDPVLIEDYTEELKGIIGQ